MPPRSLLSCGQADLSVSAGSTPNLMLALPGRAACRGTQRIGLTDITSPSPPWPMGRPIWATRALRRGLRAGARERSTIPLPAGHIEASRSTGNVTACT